MCFGLGADAVQGDKQMIYPLVISISAISIFVMICFGIAAIYMRGYRDGANDTKALLSNVKEVKSET